MLYKNRRSARGFTLIELAIVLAIAGLLFVGLWRLLSGGNTQLRDQSAAAQQQQLISAVKAYLASTSGSSFMTTNAGCGGNCAPGANFPLPLPAATNAAGTAGCYTDPTLTAAGVNGAGGFCDFLPPGFSQATANSYGQTYYSSAGFGAGIRILRDGTTAGSAPHTYSFMIITQGGDVIPDTSGGRISSLIGGDGGFVYSSNVCNPAGTSSTSYACGTYGAWSVNITSFGYAALANGGYVASRTFVSPEQDSLYPWLARYVLPSDSSQANSPVFNKMISPFFLGGQTAYLGSDWLAAPPTGGTSIATTNLSGIVAQGSNINMGFTTGGTATTPPTGLSTIGGGNINLQGGEIEDLNRLGALGTNSAIELDTAPGTSLVSINPLITLNTRCSVDATAASNDPSLTPLAGCTAGFQDHGDAFFGGRVNVNSLYATTFIYQSSDFRLKTNIHSISDPLVDVMKLKPVSFVFKASGKAGLGVIAQDVEKVYPQLVSDRGDGMKAVNYEGLIGPLLGAVQELKHENDNLRQQIKDEQAFSHNLQQQIEAKTP